MIRRIFLIIIHILPLYICAQIDVVANSYFENGEYEKALIEYEKLHEKQPRNNQYISKIVKTLQQLENYNDAERFLLDLVTEKGENYPAFFIELGYNYQLKGNLLEANTYYNKALSSIESKRSHVYPVTTKFREYTLLDFTLSAYEKAMQAYPNLNFDFQIAQIYGEQGDVKKMFDSYMNLLTSNTTSLTKIERGLSGFITENHNNESNVLLKHSILKKAQKEPNIIWNKLLSWLFTQERDFKNAFAQEKAIFRRDSKRIDGINKLSNVILDDHDVDISIKRNILTYISEVSRNTKIKLGADINLLNLDIEENENLEVVRNKYLKLLDAYGSNLESLDLHIAYAHFLGFHLHEEDNAISFLENSLDMNFNAINKGRLKLKLADILVLKEHFNKALIYYSQVQRNLKNSTLSQEARYKASKTSFYKGDFIFAESQLNVLKSSTSQLFANDALNLKLIISDSKKEEDSLQTSLKYYAKADLLAFQNKTKDAIDLLNTILINHKEDPVVPLALYKQAQLFQKTGNISQAASNYELIISDYNEGFLLDDTLFQLAKIYDKDLNQPEKAKELYENIVFNHPDSIYFVDARKRYRTLRGDTIN